MTADTFPTSTPRPRHDGWTPQRQSRFIAALGETGCVRAAASRAGISDTAAYRFRRRSEAFRAAWDAALVRASADLEAIAYDRATKGRLRVRSRGGEELWSERVQSDALLLTLLKARMPEKYGAGSGGKISAGGGYRDPHTGRYVALPPLTTPETFPPPDAEGFVTVTVRMLPEDADLYCSPDYMEMITTDEWREWADMGIDERERAMYDSVCRLVAEIEARREKSAGADGA